MSKTTTDLKTIIKFGGGISIDGNTKTTSELQSLAEIAKLNGATIIIRNAGNKTTTDLKSIASLAPKQIIFEI